jgi:DNA-binding MarR family transcriptional regulator
VLVAFADDPDQRLEDAATQLALHLSSVSKAVKTLESLGLIEVEALGGGRQMRRLLTHEGRSVVSRLVGHAEDVLNERKPG